jgi:tyrosinase
LKPFYSDPGGNFWTSDTVRDHTKFGYTYVEVQKNDQASVRAAVNALYGPLTAPSDGPRKLRRAVAGETEGNSTAPQGYSAAPPASAKGPEDRLYNLNVRAPKNALASSFYIDFFLDGPATNDPTNWPSDANFLGSQAVIAMISPGNMAAVAVAGVVPLNDALQYLVGLGRLPDLSVASVMTLLKGHLAWRVRLSDGSNVPIEQVPDLRVSVASVGMVVSDRHDEFPKYNGEWDVHTDVTEGKPGGLCSYEEH